MRKDNHMETRVTKNGFRYYTNHSKTNDTAVPLSQRGRFLGRKLGQSLWTGVKHLPWLLMRVVTLMVATPLMILLFLFNLVKSLIITAVGWFVFKVLSFFVLGFGIAAYSFLIQKDVSVPWFSSLMDNFVFPHGVPIYYWWETTIIVVFAVITAISLTLHPQDA